MKVGVLSVLATATIAAPLAAAAAGIDETAAQPESVASDLPDVAEAESLAAAAAPVALPAADAASAQTATEVRDADDSADRSQERASASEKADDAKKSEKSEEADDSEGTGIEVSVPEPETVVAADGQDVEVAPASSGGYIKPVSGPVTSSFGGRMHPVLGYFKGHNGVDFGAACGTPVQASKAGTVVAVEYNSASGNRVKVDHGNGVVTGYYHLQGFNTSVGATVDQGDIVGYVGSTGRSTGCHLHFAKMDEAGNYSNPMSLLQ